MLKKLADIQKIAVEINSGIPSADDSSKIEKFELRDEIVNKIRRIAGKNSIKRVVPVQKKGDHKMQEICFNVDDTLYVAVIRYNNALTEGQVSDLRRVPKKC
ncbi:hypothetical protein CUJ83_11495 [Methanocella sp. CWC-04]|uniref:Uncharacterized protein n=1 Tax=Methanooceanicella nereidis TaxID=2052831 RepID=A0AAP2RG50_9EURY|nr:hypothetical protein [Methanocella sp. CWC-04]MCD1295622.1 hypothetical protein [Methanocella sp. CWC-04]